MKYEKNKIKEHKAITLIALVITIIVLLILAGITVAQLSGNNLFENAKLAKEKYKQAREDEDETLEDYEDAITGDRGKKVTYSTEEQVVGTWIDGKEIWQKTFALNYTTCDKIDANYMHGWSVSSYNIETPIDVKLIFTDSGKLKTGNAISSNSMTYSVFPMLTTDYLYITTGNDMVNRITNFYATIQYTKK